MVQTTVTIAPMTLATANPVRRSITFFNASLLGETISISKDGAKGLTAANREYVLNPGNGLSFTYDLDGADICGEWGGYGSADTAIIVIGEMSFRKKE